MSVSEYKLTMVYLTEKGVYDVMVWERSVVGEDRGKWKGRAHLVVPSLDGRVSARSRLKSVLVRVAASLPSI